MKFRYEYRTSDNVRHSDVVVAKNREAVFSALAKRGIKPGFVEALPDPWRSMRISLGVALIVLLVGVSLELAHFARQERASIVSSMTRRQIQGNPLVIEQGVAGGWREVFTEPADLHLARYAQPGWRVRQSDDAAWRAQVATNLLAKCHIRFTPDDLPEFRQLKRIVVGLREEASAFITAGGAVETYLALLDERQMQELSYQEKIAEDFLATLETQPETRHYDAWLTCNRKLSARGLKTIAMPEKIFERLQLTD